METQLELKGKRINLGAGYLKYPDKTFRKLSYFLAAVWLVLLFVSIFKKNNGLFEKVGIPAIYALNGIFFFFKAHFELSPTSKYAPHFIISKDGLKTKRSVLKKSEFINWNDVKKIELGYYKIGIKDRTGLQFYPYTTRKETSIEIKREIESIAVSKGIEVENLLKR
ncbi:hypothetical protein [Marivirga sp.]|uniref:hypothetical protein n=1 Tax=Marivirga sp. TaxID=2018662 RepID=UPI0025FF31E9|nr:hypothetical protein [Marivirga sp.]